MMLPVLARWPFALALATAISCPPARPPHPPAPPPVGQLTVIVEAGAASVPGAVVTLERQPPIVRADVTGPTTFDLPIGGSFNACAEAAGFVRRCELVTFSATQTVTIALAREGSAPAPPSADLPPPPTRDELRAVRCEIAYTEADGQHSAWPAYAYAGWDAEQRAAARALWRSHGMTHVPINFALDYPNAGVPPFDYRDRPAAFVEILKELRRDRLIAVLSAAQVETYGGFPDAAPILADIGRWPAWGWAEHVFAAFAGYETKDFLADDVQKAVLRKLREVLGPDKWVGHQFGNFPAPGCDGGGACDREPIWHGPGVDGPTWWREMRGTVDALLLQVTSGRFERLSREQVVDDIAGLVTRLTGPFAIRTTWPWGGSVDPAYLENWRSPYAIGVDVVYWEGPDFLRWSSARKAEWAGWVQEMVPTLAGTCQGR